MSLFHYAIYIWPCLCIRSLKIFHAFLVVVVAFWWVMMPMLIMTHGDDGVLFDLLAKRIVTVSISLHLNFQTFGIANGLALAHSLLVITNAGCNNVLFVHFSFGPIGRAIKAFRCSLAYQHSISTVVMKYSHHRDVSIVSILLILVLVR